MSQVVTWPAFTNLIQDSDGSYKQTGQTTEISNCLSAAVKRAHSNLLLINSFPGLEEQERWLTEALKFELPSRTDSPIIQAVGERAKVDLNYFYCLLSMVIAKTSRTFKLLTTNQIRNRWSGYRQSALNMVRDLLGTRSKSKKAKIHTKPPYGLLGSDTEKAAAATKLLDQDAFHFRTTSTVRFYIRPNIQHISEPSFYLFDRKKWK